MYLLCAYIHLHSSTLAFSLISTLANSSVDRTASVRRTSADLSAAVSHKTIHITPIFQNNVWLSLYWAFHHRFQCVSSGMRHRKGFQRRRQRNKNRLGPWSTRQMLWWWGPSSHCIPWNYTFGWNRAVAILETNLKVKGRTSGADKSYCPRWLPTRVLDCLRSQSSLRAETLLFSVSETSSAVSSVGAQ